MARQGKWFILAALGAPIAVTGPAHAQVRADGVSSPTGMFSNASSKPEPIGNPAQWFGADAYPPEALRKHEEGTVGVAIAIDANGMPTRCSVAKASGYAALDQGTCSIFLAHVRYRPGTDSEGRAIPSTWKGSVTWRLAGQNPPNKSGAPVMSDGPAPTPLSSPATWFSPEAYPLEAKRAGQEGTVVFGVDVDASGHIVSCRIMQSSGSPALDAQTCALVRKNGEFAPAHDVAGKAVAGTWVSTTNWKLTDTPIDLASGPLVWSATTQYTLDEHGNAVDCTSIATQGGIVSPCRDFVPGMHMGPAISHDGVPVRGKLTMTVSSKIEPLPPEQ